MAPSRINFALCGLGYYAENWIAPAIAQSSHGRLKGIITGSLEKVPQWQKKYQIPDSNIYSYNSLDSIASNPEIDCVYIVTPTGLHCEHTLRCLQAGKHVIVEKPMAIRVEECEQMIQASKVSNKTLQIGYRLHWDPFNLAIMQAMHNKTYGEWTSMRSGFSYDQGSIAIENDWRMTRSMNAEGALYDIGVYVVQSAFYSAQTQPFSVQAKSSTTRSELFTDFPEHWEWTFHWPEGQVSQHRTSYGIEENFLKIETASGSLGIDSAFGYDGQIGYTPNGTMHAKHLFQQKAQIDGQCLAIMGKEESKTPANMGLRDIQIIERIIESANNNCDINFPKSCLNFTE